MTMQDTIEQLRNFDASDLDVNNIGSWPSAFKGIIMVLLMALVLGLGYTTYLSAKQDDIERAERKQAEFAR